MPLNIIKLYFLSLFIEDVTIINRSLLSQGGQRRSSFVSMKVTMRMR